MAVTPTQQKMIDQKIANWLARLFDLTARNRLLFFKPTKTTTVAVTIPEFYDLFYRLVDKGGTLKFPVGEDLPLPDDGIGDKVESTTYTYRENEIGSGGSLSGMGRTLYNLYARSRTAREEQGVNILFLGFGLLQWRDLKQDALAHSPVILVPVELTREAPGKPYQLSMVEDDIVVNPTLKEALRQYYAIELADLPDEFDKDGLAAYLESVQMMAAPQNEWSLDLQVMLDVFSYQKQIIVADLIQNSAALKIHPLVQSMSIPGFPLPQNNLNLLTALELDEKVPPQQVFQILDADSSQQEAIEAAKAGLSFVLQGPPGTGKSQTIANIITEFLASGRHVLFVSAKMAALEVVQERLKKGGLGDFCLQVHSHKRNKREVVQELGVSLAIEPEAAPGSILSRLEILGKIRSSLNNYVHTLHAPQFSLRLSAYQAYCELMQLRDAPDVRGQVPNLGGITPYQLDTLKNIVESLSVFTAIIADHSAHPWYGVRLDSITIEKQAEIETRLAGVRSNLGAIAQQASHLAAVYGIAPPENYTQSAELYPLAREYTPAVMQIAAAELKARYEQKYQSILRWLRPQYWVDAGLLAQASRAKSRPNPVKAVQDLARIASLQSRRLAAVPAGEAAQLDCSPQELERMRDLSEKLSAGVNFLIGLYQKERLPQILANLSNVEFSQVNGWLLFQLDQIQRLPEWVNFDLLYRQAAGAGIENFVVESLKIRLPGGQWLPAFLKRFYLLWIDAIGSQSPAFASFNSQIFENNIEKFRELDREHIRLSKFRIREGLLLARPKAAWMNVASSEEAILRREMNKKRRLKPLRRLFGEIPGLILRLRPCLMMSPLTVSQLLNPELFKFDLIIFDEASQIHPEEAVGAIIRGTQTIIVGDKHQLPPTSFFEVLESEEGTEDENVVEDLESILNEGEAAGLSNKMLQWHYRSKDESLIAFSNHNFYDDRLLTFPNSQQGNPGTGVSFLFLADGVYQRGGRRNLVEALKVVDLMLEHFQNSPELSLGVVTFSQAQKDTIQWELDLRLRKNPGLQVYFSDSVVEPPFIKNLELVQGDERDVMIFSIGYGRDETNKFILNFGPLNKEGGERRLNVAVTRARRKVILVSSIHPEDIDLSRTASLGVRLLRSYMTLARDGLSAVYADLKVDENAKFESTFESSIFESLENRGLQMKRQVGVSGYRIDLAVIDPQQPGHFILGIECDGAMYHSAATARDRDRLRQQVLEGLGWRIHRIWSRDWYNDPQAEIEKVLKIVAQLLPNPASDAALSAHAEKKTPELRLFDADVQAVRVIQPPSGLPKGAVYFQETVLPFFGNGLEDFYRRPQRVMVELIEKIVNNEGPILIDAVTSRIAKAWGIPRTGMKMKSTILYAAYDGESKGRFEKRGDFLWPKGLAAPTVRAQAQGGAGRDLDQICDEEIAEAVFIILNEAISLERDDLIKLTARLFGSRANGKTAEKVNAAVGVLIKKRRIEWRGDKLRIPRE